MHSPEINISKRFNKYCRAESKKGYVCSLYLDHISEEHKDNHMHHSWKDGE